MIILGIVLLIAGFLLKISILWTFGILVLFVGLVLTVMGSMGHAIGGRRTYYYAAPTANRPVSGTQRGPHTLAAHLLRCRAPHRNPHQRFTTLNEFKEPKWLPAPSL